jgi:hypothetical protein
VKRWLEASGHEAGATLSAETLSELAQAWWDDRLAADWRPRPSERSQAILEQVGLTGEFWALR